MFLDFMYSKEGIDRKGIMTGITGSMEGHNAFDAGYFSMVTKLNYRFLPKWNAFVKGMYETASLTKQQGDLEKANTAPHGVILPVWSSILWIPTCISSLHT